MLNALQKAEQIKWNRRKQHVKKYIEEGLSMTQIANKFGCHRSTLTKQAIRMGLYSSEKVLIKEEQPRQREIVKLTPMKTHWVGGNPFYKERENDD